MFKCKMSSTKYCLASQDALPFVHRFINNARHKYPPNLEVDDKITYISVDQNCVSGFSLKHLWVWLPEYKNVRIFTN